MAIHHPAESCGAGSSLPFKLKLAKLKVAAEIKSIHGICRNICRSRAGKDNTIGQSL
jgi:hypothetical protein